MTAFKDWLNGLPSKTTPVDADELYVRDSSGTPGSKKLTWANLKATLATTFDAVYLKLTGGTLAGGTRTSSGSTLVVTETVNNTGVAFPGALVVNQTDTGSADKSKIASFQASGTQILGIRRASFGGTTHYDRTVFDTTQYTYFANGGGGFFAFGGDESQCYMSMGGQPGFSVVSGYFFGWSDNPSNVPSGSADLTLYRDAANTLAQRNSTNAQTYRTYGTYTDGSNYRRLTQTMSTAGVAEIKPEGAGTGASGNVLHISGLPTSNPGAGILWNDGGTVKVGT